MTTSPPPDLPTTIRDFLAAHTARDTATALRAFSAAAVVVDDGRIYRGTEEVTRFLTRAGAEFTYTTEVVGARRVDERHWVVRHRLEGDFPGGTAELDFRFALDGDLVTELVIAPSPHPR